VCACEKVPYHLVVRIGMGGKSSKPSALRDQIEGLYLLKMPALFCSELAELSFKNVRLEQSDSPDPVKTNAECRESLRRLQREHPQAAMICNCSNHHSHEKES